MECDAIMSPDGLYRYWLKRKWDRRTHHRPWQGDPDPRSGFLLWIMLNPSTADALEDDATIRKCIGFAQRWGFEHIEVVNLFAFRTTYQDELFAATDPMGPDNDSWITNRARDAEMIVAAWGDGQKDELMWQRQRLVRDLVAKYNVDCIGRTKSGNPRHPSRPGYATPREAFWRPT